MVKDVVRILLEDYSRTNFSIQIPDCFDILKGTDANFELVAASTMQPVRVYYTNNIVTKSIAIIFGHTNVNGLEYEEATEKVELCRKVFKDIFEFDEVEVHLDSDKKQMIEALKSVKHVASEFEINRSGRDNLVVGVAHVGFHLNCERFEDDRTYVEKIEGYVRPEKAADSSLYRRQYAFDTHGEPIGLTEYSIDIAGGSHTHVIQFFDFDLISTKFIDALSKDGKKLLSQDPKFHELLLSDRSG